VVRQLGPTGKQTLAHAALYKVQHLAEKTNFTEEANVEQRRARDAHALM
jgi:hypothetical protein